MTEISAAAVKALRELTNLPLMDCKQALTEANGDQDKAVEILRSKFKKVMLKRADNATSEGKIWIEVKADGEEKGRIARNFCGRGTAPIDAAAGWSRRR